MAIVWEESTSEKEKYFITQNAFGHYWPRYTCNGYEVIIRNSNPFKTLKGALKFIEETKKRLPKKER